MADTPWRIGLSSASPETSNVSVPCPTSSVSHLPDLRPGDVIMPRSPGEIGEALPRAREALPSPGGRHHFVSWQDDPPARVERETGAALCWHEGNYGVDADDAAGPDGQGTLERLVARDVKKEIQEDVELADRRHGSRYEHAACQNWHGLYQPRAKFSSAL